MGKQIQIRVDESLADILNRVQKEIAEDFKKQYNLSEITIYGTVASQVLAAKLKGNKVLNFTIEKNGLNKGILKLR
jgi:hypothetical protein